MTRIPDQARVDYDRRQYAVYSQGRSPTPGVVELWTRVLQKHVEPGDRVLDLGSGVGTYSELLAEACGASVAAVEPSVRMREIAEREHAHPRVRYLEGSAERIPLPDAGCDVALLSNVIHHVADRDACLAELWRVVRPAGLVLVRGTLTGPGRSVRFLDFFPTARHVAERLVPSVDEVVAMFERQGFEQLSGELVAQETTSSFGAYVDRIGLRAISVLELISDADFEAGMARMRHEAEKETTPQPVIESVDLLTFRRPG